MKINQEGDFTTRAIIAGFAYDNVSLREAKKIADQVKADIIEVPEISAYFKRNSCAREVWTRVKIQGANHA